MRWMAALLLFAQAQDDKSAEALLQEVRRKIDTATTVRVEYAIEVARGTEDQGGAKGTVLLKGKDRWKNDLELRMDRRSSEQNMKVSLVSDGRKVASLIPMGKTGFQTMGPEQNGRFLRESLGSSLFTVILYSQPLFGDRPEMQVGSPTLTSVKDAGKDKVGEKAVRVVEYSLKFSTRGLFGDADIKIRAFIDPEKKVLLRREMDLFGTQLVEKFEAFAFDEEVADSEFTFQSLKRLTRARAEQAARSVELFARFTGRNPASFNDMVRRPASLEPDLFFPEGGFLPGGAAPKDAWGRPFGLRLEGTKLQVVSLGGDGKAGGIGDNEDVVFDVAAANRTSVGGPTDRLKKQYAARVQIGLLAAAVRGYLAAYGELPKKKSALWEKPEWAEVWPEGGWIAGGRIPDDPWGEPYRVISEPEVVRVQVNDPRARLITFKGLTPAELRALEESARPRLTAEERKEMARLIEDLGQDDLELREKSEGKLKAFGLAAIQTLDERLKVEKDAETKARLAGIRRSIRVPRDAWKDELGLLAQTVSAAGPPGPLGAAQSASNHRNASASLKTLATAEADFRANDRDGNGVNDFWTGDVAGLYCVYTRGDANKSANKLIELSVAAADGAPLEAGAAGGLHLGLDRFAQPSPKAGYHYRSMTQDNSETPPQSYLQDTGGAGGMGKVHHVAKFGFCAYPADYPASGTMTYIINEGNTIFQKDTGGEPVLEWPSDNDLRNDWSKMD